MTTRVLVCRGCCCGTERKHPETDHDAQLAAISAVARTRVVDCVDECAHSNIVVVRPGDGTSVWLGGILDPAATSALCDWLAAGATSPMPAVLQGHVFERRGSEPVQVPVQVPVLVQVSR